MATNIGYESDYELYTDWDYKKKRTFIPKKEIFNNYNVIFIIIIIGIIIYIPFNFCMFNFNIDINKNNKQQSINTDINFIQNKRNICQNYIIYALNFNNIFISIIFYILLFSIIIFILHYFKLTHYLYNTFFTNIIKPYLDLLIGCSYSSIKDLKHPFKHIKFLLKNKKYYKLFYFLTKFISLILILITIILFISYLFYSLYIHYINKSDE